MSDKVNEIKNALQHFNGTEMFYSMPIAKSKFTDGLKYLTEVAQCFWLITDACVIGNSLKDKSYFITIDFKRLPEEEQHQQQCEAVIIYSDGNDNILKTQKYVSTDFPLDKLRLFYVDNTLMLPSEY